MMHTRLPTTSAFQVNTKHSKQQKSTRSLEPFCAFCDSRGHWAQDCKTVTNVNERIERLKRSSRCFLCLNRGHTSKNCSKRGKALCTRCKGTHHYSICTAGGTTKTFVNQISSWSPDYTHLQIARVRIVGPTGLSKVTRYVLDRGSQSSFVCTSLVEKLKLNITGEKEVTITPFESLDATPERRRLISFHL